jgi:hypothetical protein
MTDNTVTPLVHPGKFTDMLTDVLRTGLVPLKWRVPSVKV